MKVDRAPPSPIEIRTTLGNDITLGIVGLLLGPLSAWGAGGGMWHLTPADLHGIRGEWLALLFLNTFGWQGVVVVTAVMALWMICLGVGGAWRVYDRTSAVLADESGIRFHPSVGPSFVPWAEVQSIRWVRKAAPAEVEITLNRRFWSMWNWATSRKVRLNHIAIGLSQREASNRVTALKALLRLHHDPD